MNADFHKFITECLGLLTENINCSYIFLPGFYEMCNLLVRRSDYPKDYQNGRIQECIGHRLFLIELKGQDQQWIYAGHRSF